MSCEEKKGAQGNVVQDIGGKKSGNPYSGKPTADVKKKRIFLTFMAVRVFPNYGKLHMNSPTNSPV